MIANAATFLFHVFCACLILSESEAMKTCLGVDNVDVATSRWVSTLKLTRIHLVYRIIQNLISQPPADTRACGLSGRGSARDDVIPGEAVAR